MALAETVAVGLLSEVKADTVGLLQKQLRRGLVSSWRSAWSLTRQLDPNDPAAPKLHSEGGHNSFPDHLGAGSQLAASAISCWALSRRSDSATPKVLQDALGNNGTPQPNAEGYLRAADEEYHWGRFETALRLYTRCLEEQRATVRAWVGQVQMLVHLCEYHEARVWTDKALELFRANGELLAAKAQACVRLGDRRAAYACSDAAMQATRSRSIAWSET